MSIAEKICSNQGSCCCCCCCCCKVVSLVSDSVRPHRQKPTRFPCPWDSPGKNTGVGCHFLLQCMKVKSQSEVAQSCPTVHHLMDCSLPGSSFHGIFQAKVLEWVAIAFSKKATTRTAQKRCDWGIDLSQLCSKGWFQQEDPVLFNPYCHIFLNFNPEFMTLYSPPSTYGHYPLKSIMCSLASRW